MFLAIHIVLAINVDLQLFCLICFAHWKDILYINMIRNLE